MSININVQLEKFGHTLTEGLPGSAKLTAPPATSSAVPLNEHRRPRLGVHSSKQIKFVFDHSSVQQVFTSKVSIQGVAGLGTKMAAGHWAFHMLVPFLGMS